MATLEINTLARQPPTRDLVSSNDYPQSLPAATNSHVHPRKPHDQTNASLFFVGTATTILSVSRTVGTSTLTWDREWEGFRMMTDPNFLHAGDHVHLGPGVTGTRKTNPAVNLEDLPHVDAVLLSHYHADHFDELVEKSLRRDLPIITTPHAHTALTSKGEDSFTAVHALDFWQSLDLSIKNDRSTAPNVSITGLPGTHVPPGPLAVANDLLGAVPPTNGWMVELGYDTQPTASAGYRIYISGDTLLFDELYKIPQMYSSHTGKPIDLMLIHLGGTTIPSPKVPLLMVTMDAKQGIDLMKVVDADVTIPIHFDDYDVFLSPLSDFQKAVDELGDQWKGRVVYLDRGTEYRFRVRKGSETDATTATTAVRPAADDIQPSSLPLNPQGIRELYPGGS